MDVTASQAPAPLPIKKEKKLPACDSCKFRRVLCHPQPTPIPCPRCVSKKINCTTTPVVRKKPTSRTGKRIEIAKITFGTLGEDGKPIVIKEEEGVQVSLSNKALSSHGGSSTSEGAPEAPSTHSSLSRFDKESLMGLSELSGTLAAHLLLLAQSAPEGFFPTPLLAPGKLLADFEAVGRRLESLPPLSEVLAYVVIAFAASLSPHPLLVGPCSTDLPEDALEGPLSPGIISMDLREYGYRRSGIVRQMRDHAAKLMGERQTTVTTCEENAASCHFMEILDTRLGLPSGRQYASAYVSHIRALADDVDSQGRGKLSSTTIHWSPFIMQEALASHNALRAPAFTKADQLTIGGIVPSLDQVLSQPPPHHSDLREVFTLLYLPMQTFVHVMADLARDSISYISGTFARSQPLNEPRLSDWVHSLKQLHNLLEVILARLEDQLTPEATAAFNAPEREIERQLVLRASRFTMTVGWSSLILPVWKEIQRRRGLDRLELFRAVGKGDGLFREVRGLTVKASRMVAERLRKDILSLAYITHLQYFDVNTWGLTISEPDLLGGPDGYTASEQIEDLTTLLAAIKRASFCWVRHASVIDLLEQRLQDLTVALAIAGTSEVSTPTPDFSLPSFDLYQNPPWVGSGDSTFLVGSSGHGGVEFGQEMTEDFVGAGWVKESPGAYWQVATEWT